VEDVVGLYIDPPDRALVFCVESQIQALDRTQPGLPMKKGRAGTVTHDYKRNGTTTLFAALNMLDGKVIGSCMPRHRHREFLRFSTPMCCFPHAREAFCLMHECTAEAEATHGPVRWVRTTEF